MTTDSEPRPNPALARMIADLNESAEERVKEIENQLLDNLIYGTPLPGQEERS